MTGDINKACTVKDKATEPVPKPKTAKAEATDARTKYRMKPKLVHSQHFSNVEAVKHVQYIRQQCQYISVCQM